LPRRARSGAFAGLPFWSYFFGLHGRFSTWKVIRVALPIIRAHSLPAWGFSSMLEWTSIFIFLRTRSSFFYSRRWPHPHSQPYLCRAGTEHSFSLPIFSLRSKSRQVLRKKVDSSFVFPKRGQTAVPRTTNERARRFRNVYRSETRKFFAHKYPQLRDTVFIQECAWDYLS